MIAGSEKHNLLATRGTSRCTMKVVALHYQILHGKPYALPLCDIRVLGRTGAASLKVLIDSGADFPVFPIKAAEDAGIELPSYPNLWVQYGGSVTAGRRTDAVIVVGEKRLRLSVVFVQKLEFPYGLLGRIGVFSQFNEVTFLEKMKLPRVELRS